MSKFNFPRVLKFLGSLFLLISLLGIIFTFLPVFKQEVEYSVANLEKKVEEKTGKKVQKRVDLTPKNKDFWVVVPKIKASAPVIENVDPANKDEYLSALKKGVAHALGTKLPGEEGNTYLFAHSTDSFLNVNYFNAVFYLLGKLNQGDEIDVYYKGEKYIYIVRGKYIVDPNSSEYFGNLGGSTITLQTCYPPGTTLKRLVVVGDLKRD